MESPPTLTNTYIIINLLKKHNLLDLYALKLSKLVDCLVRLIRGGGVVKESVDDFLRVELLEVLQK